MSDLAPIAVSTYIRLSHLQQTINALQNNTLAKDSEVYILSDAPKAGHENKVRELRKYLRTITGFKKVYIIERKTNSRVENNRGGMQMLLEKYGKVIFLEEDVVTAPRFLSFINEALDFYKDDERVFAICGYSPPIMIPEHYRKDVYLSPRFSAWGFGIRKEMFEKITMDIDKTLYADIVCNRQKLRKFMSIGGDALNMLKREAEGTLNALDVKIFYTQYIHTLFTLHPTFSLTNNIGFDGTGRHCGVTKRFAIDLAKAEPRKLTLTHNISIDEEIIHRLRCFRENGYKNRLFFFLKRIGIIR